MLSIQTLPAPLKDLAYRRLEEIKSKIPEYNMIKTHPVLLDITLGQIEGVQNFLKASDQSHLWKDCVEFNHRLDKTRDQNFEEVTPEFRDFV